MNEIKDLNWFTDITEKFMSRGYFNEGEDIHSTIKNISEHSANILGKDKEYSDKLENYLKKGFYVVPTPVWKNFNSYSDESPISCFGVVIGDSVKSIMTKSVEVAMQNKIGGGTSGTFSFVRPRGSKINGVGKTNGAVSMMEIYQTVAKIISQPNRRGHFSATLDIEHDDFDEFIGAMRDEHPLQTISTSVTISDRFMNKVLEGDDKSVKRFNKLVKARYETGFPYIFFSDNVNNNRKDIFKLKGKYINHSNMCVSGTTKVLTDKGYLEIESLVGSKVPIWNGDTFSESEVVKTGDNQELFSVELSTGQSLECTAYHRFFVKNKYGGKVEEKRLHELQVGDKLIKFALPLIEGSEHLEFAYDNGFYSGDGTELEYGKKIYLYGDKVKLKDYLKSVPYWNNISGEKGIYGISKNLKEKYFVPSANYSVSSRLEWLAGIADSDGCKVSTNNSEKLYITSINKKFLKDIQLMLQTLGCHSTVLKQGKGGIKKLPNGRGGKSEYTTQDSFRLLVSGYSLNKLVGLGFKPNRLKFSGIKPNREASSYPKVKSIVKLEGLFSTFCFKEPIKGAGMFNGILAGNCQEILLPNSPEETFVCCLLGMNAELFDYWKDTDAVEVGIYFMDSMLQDYINKVEREKEEDINFYNLIYKPSVDFIKNYLAVGMGQSGLHSYMQSKGIAFHSFEGLMTSNLIQKTIYDQSHKASEKMAKEYGRAKIFEGTDIKRRHSTLTAIAPNTSSSFIMNMQSQSIEPYTSNYYVKDVVNVKTPIKNPYLKKVLEKHGKDNKEVWDDILKHNGSVQHLEFLTEHEKNVFKTFLEIPQDFVLEMASGRQKFLCQSQSLNLMVGKNVEADYVTYLILKAWKLGIRTLYYQLNVSGAQEFKREHECVSCSA